MLTLLAKTSRDAVAKRVARQALTKTAWYPVLKKLLSSIGIKITKQTVGNAAGKVVMGIGGVISGTVTFIGLTKGSNRLCNQLKTLPQAVEPLPVEVTREETPEPDLEDREAKMQPGR